MVKRAPVDVLFSGPVSPGKYLILVTGGEAEVEESWQAGMSDGGERVVDSLYLPGVHADALDAVRGVSGVFDTGSDSLGVLETSTVSAAIVACDAACKTAPVRVVEMRLGQGIGGKGVFTLAGELSDVEASLAAAETAIEERRAVVGRELIPRPDAAFSGGLR